MSCIYPLTVKNRLGNLVQVSCGQCLSCRIRKRSEWIHRMECEAHDKECCFVTLTYRDSFNLAHGLNFTHLKDFMYRLRRTLSFRGFPPVKFFACGEYGDKNQRRHFHLAIFNLSSDFRSLIESCWFAGKVDVRPLCHNRIQYLLKYLKKGCSAVAKTKYKALGLTSPSIRCSQGLGKDWLISHMDFLKSHPYYYRNGRRYSLPKYYTKRLDTLFDFKSDNLRLKEYAKSHNLSSPGSASVDIELTKMRNEIKAAHNKGYDCLDILGLYNSTLAYRSRKKFDSSLVDKCASAPYYIF